MHTDIVNVKTNNTYKYSDKAQDMVTVKKQPTKVRLLLFMGLEIWEEIIQTFIPQQEFG
jgi:hypothetical protein